MENKEIIKKLKGLFQTMSKNKIQNIHSEEDEYSVNNKEIHNAIKNTENTVELDMFRDFVRDNNINIDDELIQGLRDTLFYKNNISDEELEEFSSFIFKAELLLSNMNLTKIKNKPKTIEEKQELSKDLSKMNLSLNLVAAIDKIGDDTLSSAVKGNADNKIQELRALIFVLATESCEQDSISQILFNSNIPEKDKLYQIGRIANEICYSKHFSFNGGHVKFKAALTGELDGLVIGKDGNPISILATVDTTGVIEKDSMFAHSVVGAAFKNFIKKDNSNGTTKYSWDKDSITTASNLFYVDKANRSDNNKKTKIEELKRIIKGYGLLEEFVEKLSDIPSVLLSINYIKEILNSSGADQISLLKTMELSIKKFRKGGIEGNILNEMGVPKNNIDSKRKKQTIINALLNHNDKSKDVKAEVGLGDFYYKIIDLLELNENINLTTKKNIRKILSDLEGYSGKKKKIQEVVNAINIGDNKLIQSTIKELSLEKPKTSKDNSVRVVKELTKRRNIYLSLRTILGEDFLTKNNTVLSDIQNFRFTKENISKVTKEIHSIFYSRISTKSKGFSNFAHADYKANDPTFTYAIGVFTHFMEAVPNLSNEYNIEKDQDVDLLLDFLMPLFTRTTDESMRTVSTFEQGESGIDKDKYINLGKVRDIFDNYPVFLFKSALSNINKDHKTFDIKNMPASTKAQLFDQLHIISSRISGRIEDSEGDLRDFFEKVGYKYDEQKSFKAVLADFMDEVFNAYNSWAATDIKKSSFKTLISMFKANSELDKKDKALNEKDRVLDEKDRVLDEKTGKSIRRAIKNEEVKDYLNEGDFTMEELTSYLENNNTPNANEILDSLKDTPEDTVIEAKIDNDDDLKRSILEDLEKPRGKVNEYDRTETYHIPEILSPVINASLPMISFEEYLGELTNNPEINTSGKTPEELTKLILEQLIEISKKDEDMIDERKVIAICGYLKVDPETIGLSTTKPIQTDNPPSRGQENDIGGGMKM